RDLGKGPLYRLLEFSGVADRRGGRRLTSTRALELHFVSGRILAAQQERRTRSHPRGDAFRLGTAAVLSAGQRAPDWQISAGRAAAARLTLRQSRTLRTALSNAG